MMQQKISAQFVVIVVVLCVAAFLLVILGGRPTTQKSHGQSTEFESPTVNISPNHQLETDDPAQTQNRHHAFSSAPLLLTNDTKSIAGKVMDRQGNELPDIQIVAIIRKSYVDKSSRSRSAHEKKMQSDAFGQYKFDELAPGEYKIQAVESAEFGSSSIYVRAGDDNADLILPFRQEHWVYGNVINLQSSPLRDVRVVPNGMISDSVYTDNKGSYEIYIARKGDIRYPDQLQFSLPGYFPEQIRLPKVDLFAEGVTLRSVQLKNTYSPGFIKGIVHADNIPVKNAKVYLRSQDSKLRYRTVTDDFGSFEIKELLAGKYTARVVAGKQYQDHHESGLRVDALGTELTIELETLQFGQLSGQMVDPEGIPVPRFTLWVASDSARGRVPRSVTGNQKGYFSIKHIPLGDINFRTRSSPRFRIKGIRVTDISNKPVQLVLDLGQYSIASQVIDTTGKPVPGTAITMSWEQKKDRITYSSTRDTTADHNGQFQFSNLSAGVYTLRFSAPGYKRRYRVNFAVGSNEMPIVTLPAPSR